MTDTRGPGEPLAPQRADHDRTCEPGLVGAIRRGLATVGDGVDWVGRFDSSLKDLGEVPEDAKVRALAAELLREAIDAWFKNGDNRSKEWGWACGKHPTLPSTSCEQDLSGAVIMRLKSSAGYFERAEGVWNPRRWENGGDPKWFPVGDRGFVNWVRDATGKEAGVIIKNASETPIPVPEGDDGELLVDGPVRPGTQVAPTEVARSGGAPFDKVREIVAKVVVSDERVLSPDLVGKEGDRRVESEQIVRAAALGAAGAVFDFLEGRTDQLKAVEALSTDAVRKARPDHPRPTRVVPDIAFALAEALRVASNEINGQPLLSSDIKAATATAFVQWRFAQVPMVAKSLFEAITANPNDDRRRGRGRWAVDLCSDLVKLRDKPSPLVPFVAGQAQVALDWLGEEALLGEERLVRLEVAASIASGEPGLARYAEGARREIAATLLSFEQSLSEFTTEAASGFGDQ